MSRIDEFFEKSETVSWFDFNFGFWINLISELVILSVVEQNSSKIFE